MEKMGEYYVKSPLIMYDKIYAQSTEKTPIVFILSPGADPQGELEILGESLGYKDQKFRYLALGQGMGEKAKQMIESGAIRGHWVML
jgi:dynein heavy chain